MPPSSTSSSSDHHHHHHHDHHHADGDGLASYADAPSSSRNSNISKSSFSFRRSRSTASAASTASVLSSRLLQRVAKAQSVVGGGSGSNTSSTKLKWKNKLLRQRRKEPCQQKLVDTSTSTADSSSYEEYIDWPGTQTPRGHVVPQGGQAMVPVTSSSSSSSSEDDVVSPTRNRSLPHARKVLVDDTIDFDTTPPSPSPSKSSSAYFEDGDSAWRLGRNMPVYHHSTSSPLRSLQPNLERPKPIHLDVNPNNRNNTVLLMTHENLRRRDHLLPSHANVVGNPMLFKTQAVPNLMDDDDDSLPPRSIVSQIVQDDQLVRDCDALTEITRDPSLELMESMTQDDEEEGSDVFDDLSLPRSSFSSPQSSFSPRRRRNSSMSRRSGVAASRRAASEVGCSTSVEFPNFEFQPRIRSSTSEVGVTRQKNRVADKSQSASEVGVSRQKNRVVEPKTVRNRGAEPKPVKNHAVNQADKSKPVGNKTLNLVMLGGGLTTIQTTAEQYRNRMTAQDYDDQLTDSDVDQYGFCHVPGFHKLVDRNLRHSSLPAHMVKRTVEPDGDYMKAPVKKDIDWSSYAVRPEEMSLVVDKFREMCREDAKPFALSEMRSRILTTDLQRGLERRGGTATVDDLVTTEYHRSAHRVRDAVLVSKAWRDGASPRDVARAVNTWRRSVDDVDVARFKCAWLGPRCLRGFEIFSIGDCQSILLKLTHEQCEDLRFELQEATAFQIEAEQHMKMEEEEEDYDEDGMMTEAEATYLASMEDVKDVSHRLVVAERSFRLVRERVQDLVTRYKDMLVNIEKTESLISEASSYCSDDDDENDRHAMSHQARRHEIQAEITARQASGQKELRSLELRLAELQSETKAHSVVLARTIKGGCQVDSVKQRFRDRRKQATGQQQKQSEMIHHVGAEMFQQLDFYERSLNAVGMS